MLKVLGITDERCECECCGRKNLKCTVALDRCDAEGNETGDVTYFGRDCAAKALLGNNKAGSVDSVEKLARSISYCRKWLRKTDAHTAKVVATAAYTRFGFARATADYAIEFPNGVVVSA